VEEGVEDTGEGSEEGGEYEEKRYPGKRSNASKI